MKKMGKKFLSTGIAVTMISSMLSPLALAADPSSGVKTKLANAVVLYLNSSDAYSKNAKVKIDSENPQVKAVVKDGSTLVPVRFVSENLGAKVEWNADTWTATITKGLDTVQLTIDSKQMQVNKAIKDLEVPAQLIEGRTMVPLRALAEALGQKVFWDDMGLIIISDQDAIFNNDKDADQIAEVAGIFNTLISVAEATASGNDGNVPENVIDGTLDTRWSSQGEGEWLQLDLGSSQKIGYAALAFHTGDGRQTIFDIAVSDDAVNWKTVFSGRSSGKTIENELFDLEDASGRYVRFIGQGNTKNKWNSITEFQVYAPNGNDTPIRRLAVVPQQKPTVTYTKPGLYNPDGSAVAVHTPNAVTGKTLNVVDFGADVKDNATDDAAAIQKAIAEANAGDEVYLPNGVYNLINTLSNDKSTNIELKSGVNLRGESQEGTVLITSLGINNPSGKTAKALGKSNIVISNMTFTSTWNGKYSSDTSTENPDKGGPQYVLQFGTASNKGSSNITVDKVTFEKFERMGVRIDSSSNIVVRNSTFRNATDVAGGGAGYGVSIQGVAKKDLTGFTNDTAFNVVENNKFEGPYIRHGALLQFYAHNNVIRNNTFKSTQLDAIDLHGEDEYLNEIYGNTISDIATGAGIGVGNTGGSAPSNHDAAGPFNYIHDNTITNSREGIKVHMGSPDTIIENNTITGSTIANGKGIYLQNAPRTIVKNNTITGNTADGFWGILLEADPGDPRTKDIAGKGDPKDIQLIGNKVSGNTNGVKIGETSTGTILTDNEVKDNKTENLVNLAGTGAAPATPVAPVTPAAPTAPAAPSAAGDGVLYPIADAEADKAGHDGNFTRMRTKRSTSGSTVRIAYFKFQVADAAAISKAIFKVQATWGTNKVDQLDYAVYGLTNDSWEEQATEKDFAGSPNHDANGVVTGVGESATLIGNITILPGENGVAKEYSIDVTNFVKTQADGTVTLMVTDDKGQNGNINLYTREKEKESERPKLEITK